MKNQMLKLTKIIMLMVLCGVFIAGSFFRFDTVAEAAAKKPSIAKEMTIPIGKMSSKVCWNKNSYEIETAKKLTVKNKVKGATYTFTSSDKKIVTISKNGGYLTGLKAGTATITCTQTLNNKKTTVGKCKVTVKNSSLKVNSDAENVFAVGSNGYDLVSYYAGVDPLFHIEYRNQNATYSLSSNSKDFTIKEVKYDASSAKDISTWEDFVDELKSFIGKNYFYGYEFTAKKAGTYTVTVKETVNKKTKSIGSFKVVIRDAHLAHDEVKLLLGDSISADSLVNFMRTDKSYYFYVEGFDKANPENNPVLITQDDYGLYIYGNKEGSAKVSIREESENGTLIGTVSIAVVLSPCEKIILNKEEYTTYVGADYFGIYFSLEPWNTTDQITITSDNPEVLAVEYDKENQNWNYKVLKAGTVNVTIKCGEQSAVAKVTVEEEEW